MRNQVKAVLFSLAVPVVLTACGGGSSGGDDRPVDIQNNDLGALSCDGSRMWSFGESNVLRDSTSYLSEPGSNTLPANSEYPCVAFWEYVPSANCSLLFSYEGYLQEFELDEVVISQIGTSGSNLVVTLDDGTSTTGTPANVSVVDLQTLPDCVLAGEGSIGRLGLE